MKKIQNGQVYAVHGHVPEGSDREFLYIRKQVLTWIYLNI